jgi:hypothetical protein
MTWRVFAAAAIGKSHIDADTPCQDAFARDVIGDTLLAAVCDGAGSQPLSHVGSQALSKAVVRELALRVAAGESLASMDAQAFQGVIGDIIAVARAELAVEAEAAGLLLSCYAATLVGVVATGSGGHLFHIGDGQGAVQTQIDSEDEILSMPENGEYANETYFFSGEEWREHLRITPIGLPIRTIALMTDGAAPFVMTKGNSALYRPFIDPVEKYLATASEPDGCAALASTLEDPRTYRITGDDKTLLLALWR